MPNKKIFIAILILLILILIVINIFKTIREPKVLTLKLYFYNTKLSKFILVTKKVETSPQNLPFLALKELINGPQDIKDVIPPFPEGTEILTFKIKDKIALCNFNKSLISYGGGSTMEVAMVGALVLTLTEYPNIDKVQILIEGSKNRYLPQGTEIEQPLERNNWEKMVKN